jgi:hypothetical protein
VPVAGAVADRVHVVAAAPPGRAAALAGQPGLGGQRGLDDRPLRIAHVRRMAARPVTAADPARAAAAGHHKPVRVRTLGMRGSARVLDRHKSGSWGSRLHTAVTTHRTPLRSGHNPSATPGFPNRLLQAAQAIQPPSPTQETGQTAGRVSGGTPTTKSAAKITSDQPPARPAVIQISRWIEAEALGLLDLYATRGASVVRKYLRLRCSHALVPHGSLPSRSGPRRRVASLERV